MMTHGSLYWELYGAALVALRNFEGDVKDISWFPSSKGKQISTGEDKIILTAHLKKAA